MINGQSDDIFGGVMSWDKFFMMHVYLAASKSKDNKTKIGAVLVKDNIIISEGYNGMPRKINDNIIERSERPEKYFWYEHAERNSIYNCARHGISTMGAICYTQGTPCSDCMRGIINAGINELVVHEQWENLFLQKDRQKWVESCNYSYIMSNEAGIKIRKFTEKLNTKTLVDGKVWDV